MGIFRKTMSILVLVCFVLSLTAASASAGRWNGDWDDCDDDCGWDDCDDDCDWDDCDDDCDDDCNWGGCGFFGFDYFNFIDFGCDFFDDWYWFGYWC